MIPPDMKDLGPEILRESAYLGNGSEKIQEDCVDACLV